MRTTHTFAECEISKAAFDEIAAKLKEAGYDHAFIDGAIDMHGIGLVAEDDTAEIELTSGDRSALKQQVTRIQDFAEGWHDEAQQYLVEKNEVAERSVVRVRNILSRAVGDLNRVIKATEPAKPAVERAG